MGAGGVQDRHAARAQGQAGHAEYPSDPRDEMRALRRLKREQEPKSTWVFTSERGDAFTAAGFARMIERAGVEATLAFKAHPHMLRHACGFALANKGTAGVPGAQEHPAHGALYRAITASVQGLLAMTRDVIM